jgi:hypothetical protein
MGKSQASIAAQEREQKDPTKPAGRWAGSAVKDPELAQELAEQAADMQRLRQRNEAKSNKVCKFLNETFYRTDKTWSWFNWPLTAQQLSVKMFFPNKNLAVDQFPNPTDFDRQCVEFKKKILKEHKIKYFPMFPENKLLELSEYI